MTGAPALTLLVMRHAEKPDDDTDRHLSPDGQVRAQNLVAYIPATFGKPGAIIAAADSHNSVRPRETVTPLAGALFLPVQMPYEDAQYAELAASLRGGTFGQSLIVVCWHHHEIPRFMHALGAAAGSYPAKWDEQVFNLILKTDLAAGGTATVAQVQEPF